MFDETELAREARFTQQRLDENQVVSKIADDNGLLGPDASLKNAALFARTRQLNLNILGLIFRKAGLNNEESAD